MKKAEGKEGSAGKEKASHRAEMKEGKEKASEKRGHGAKARPKHGKRPGVPDWVELKPEEAVEAIVNLVNAGHSGSEIGMMLRDQYGVPSVKALTGKSIDQILKEQGLLPEIPEDLMNLIKKSVTLRRHLEKNKKDQTARLGLLLAVSKIRALVKYHKGQGRLPMDWRYSAATAELLVK